MTRFKVPDMSCNHCTAAIERAIKAVDPVATVECDLDNRTVNVDSATDTETLVAAMQSADYPATPA